MASRRGRGEGSIFLRADGQWTGIISLGTGPDGKRLRRTVYGTSKAEVMDRLGEVRKEIEAGVLTPSKLSVADYFNRWLEDAVRPSVRANTYVSYSDTLRLYVTPKIGGLPIAALTPMVLQKLMADLEREGRSPRCRTNVYRVLRNALQQAGPAGWRLLANDPMIGVKCPRYVRAPREVWTAEQVQAFIKATATHRLHALFVLALTTGMRQGELLGLQWGDVDLLLGRLFVRCQLIEVHEHGKPRGEKRKQFLDDPKTAAGKRNIDLPEIAIAALKKHRVGLLKEGLAACPQVFPSKAGTYLLKTNVSRAYHDLREAAGLPDISFHDLRHTCATLLRKGGLDLKVLQVQLGHSQFSVTADTYSHVLPEERSEAARIVDGVFGGEGK